MTAELEVVPGFVVSKQKLIASVGWWGEIAPVGARCCCPPWQVSFHKHKARMVANGCFPTPRIFLLAVEVVGRFLSDAVGRNLLGEMMMRQLLSKNAGS